MSNIGQLIQPFVTVTWGGINLSSYDDGGGQRVAMAQNVRLGLNKKDSAPECQFEIYATPAGFKLFKEVKDKIDQPFEVVFGYPNSSSQIKQKFRFAGVELTTGLEPKIMISGVSVVKGCWTDSRINFTMEKEISLKEFPDFLKKQVGDCAKELKIEFDPKSQAAEDAAKIKIKLNQIKNRTPHVILTNILRAQGMEISVGDSAFNGDLTISYPLTYRGEPERAQPKVITKVDGAQPGERKVFIVGPTLMISIKRSQKFNIGSSAKAPGANINNPVVNETDADKVPQPQDAKPQTEAVETEGEAPTVGSSNPSDSQTATTETSGNEKDAQAELARIITSTVTADFPMLPYIVGIKPRDIIVIPSLRGPGSYLEDWEVTNVSYEQSDSGQVNLSVTGQRPYIGEEPMIDGGTQAKVRGVISQLTTAEAWADFYWSGGKDAGFGFTSAEINIPGAEAIGEAAANARIPSSATSFDSSAAEAIGGFGI